MKDQLHNRASQNSHSHRTGNSNQHIELNGHVYFILDLTEVVTGSGLHNAGDHGSP